MNRFSFDLLDVTSPQDRDAYERAFYTAFQRAVGNRLIRQLWTFDDAGGRLATRIPYEDQLIYVLRDKERRIVTALGVNVAMRSLQAAAFGFELQDTAGSCELLTFFSVNEYQLDRGLRFQRDSFRDLHKRGFHSAFATTARRPLRTYLRVGGLLLAEKEIEGEMRYFLKFSLTG
jgi:hypothetical protein